MLVSVGRECGQCSRYYRFRVEDEAKIVCPHCGNESATLLDNSKVFNECPFCQSKQFYRRKDFNQVLGCTLIVIGAALVPFTYGLSLPVLVLIDWLLYRRVTDMAVCYSCGAEYRGIGHIPERITGFDHHTAELYES